MKANANNILNRNIIFAWIAVISACVLLVPLTAMQIMESVHWSLMDFVLMGTLLFCGGSLLVLALRKVERKYWLALGIFFLAMLIYVWAELAVGVFTGLGS